ncbi:nucleotidyltransferase domain-containing protein [Sphingomonas sp. BAUL-RG-20F-R05-02]|uniref:nucleotidyltransferase domain-containing protein n=1 Tax=Sphingomonas sp. BAUL-RG-20F-R05-02 TaxID=2914830 RepID=UPI001F58DBC9|nr:nucleotidyltransferase domain-containing protein [Sphingomonas sp. BAUL-RG-20F-R05-02]
MEAIVEAIAVGAAAAGALHSVHLAGSARTIGVLKMMERSFMVGIPDGVAGQFQRWAANMPEISHLWLYGSRARGTHNIDGDVDLAVGIKGWDSESEDAQNKALSIWLSEGRFWKARLQMMTPLKVHLNSATRYDETLLSALKREGILLYSA